MLKQSQHSAGKPFTAEIAAGRIVTSMTFVAAAATAIGALAIGAVAIGALTIKQGNVEPLSI